MTRAATPRKRRGRAAARLALALLGAAAGLAGLELFSRRAWPQFGLEALVQRFRSGDDSDSRFRASPTLGWEPRPSPARDALNFMTRHDFSEPKRPGERRVLIVGDSIGERIAGGLEELDEFEKGLRPPGGAAKVWAFVAGSYNLPHYERILRFRADKLSLDAVVVLFCLNDVSYRNIDIVLERSGRLYAVTGGRMSKALSVSPFLFARSHLYRTLWIRLNDALLAQAAGVSEDESLSADLDRIAAWCRARGVELYAVVFPYFKPFRDYKPEEKECYRKLRAWLPAAGVPWLDLHRHFNPRDWSVYRQADRSWDYVHPNRAGEQEARARIIEFLKRPPSEPAPKVIK